MSSRRSRQASGSSRITDDQIIELVSKLQQLLPEIRNRRSNKVRKSVVAASVPLISVLHVVVS